VHVVPLEQPEGADVPVEAGQILYVPLVASAQ
jgi:hypothetical protein